MTFLASFLKTETLVMENYCPDVFAHCKLFLLHDYNVHASTDQCEDCSGRAPAWSCSLPELSFPSSRRCLFCSLVIVRFAFLVVICFALCLLYALSEQQALSFWFLFLLVAAVLLIVVHFMMSAARKRSLYNCFFLFWVALSFLCICCGVLPARRYSSRDCIKL